MSDDYKSLEHIIRNIQSKIEETTSENKSLEHTIRDIHENFISVGKKTSKFEGLTKNKVYGDRVQPINQHAVQPKKPKDNEALEKAKETISGLAKEESSFADRTTKPIDEKKKKVDEEEPKLHSEMNVNVSGHGQFTGGQFTASAKAHPGHITPHGHSDKGEIAGAYRKRAKEKAGLNRVAEENINEASAAAVAKMAPTVLDVMAPVIKKSAQQAVTKIAPAAGPIGAAAGVMTKAAPYIQKMMDYTPAEVEAAKQKLKAADKAKSEPVVIKPETPTAPPKQEIKPGGTAPVYTPSKQTLPPIEVMGKPKEAPIAKPEVPTATAPITGKEKVAAPPAVAQPTTGAATAGATTGTSAVTAARQAANADTAAQSGAKAQAQSQAQAKTATDTMAEPPPSRGLGLPAFGGAVADSMYHKDYLSRSPTSVGHAKAHRKHGPVKEETDGGVERKKIQNVPRPDAGDRHKIAFVGRKDDDPKTAKEKTSRQAAYKTNVIDEGKKLAGIIKGVMKDSKERYEDGKTIVYPQVIINPNLKHNTMDADDSRLPNDKK